jgi:hypothetical protein
MNSRRCGALIEEHRPGNAAGLSSTAAREDLRYNPVPVPTSSRWRRNMPMTRTMRCAASASGRRIPEWPPRLGVAGVWKLNCQLPITMYTS